MEHDQSFVVLQVQSLEAVIADKKRQVERLVAEMKEANLESLAIAPADEVKHLLEGGFLLRLRLCGFSECQQNITTFCFMSPAACRIHILPR
jgi:hypothetical protein